MLTMILKACAAAGIELTFEVLGDVKDLCMRSAELGFAEAEYELAKKAGREDADILGGDVQELSQRCKNLMAMIEQKYPAALYAAVVGIVDNLTGGGE